MVLIKSKFSKLINTNKNGRNYANKRKCFGDKSLEFNGSKKVNVIPNFFIDPPWPIELTTESLRY